MPRRIQIVPTNICNLKCSYCFKQRYGTVEKHMIPEVYKKIKEQAFPKAETVQLQGLGEPTLYPFFTDMLQDALDYDLEVNFTTNGSNLTCEQMNLIVKGKSHIVVSIDGAKASTHESVRIGSDLKQILETLEAFKNIRIENNSSLALLSFNTVLTKNNVHEIPDIIKLAKKYNAFAVNLLLPCIKDFNDELAQSSIINHKNLFEVCYKSIMNVSKETGVLINIPSLLLPQLQNNNTITPIQKSDSLRNKLFPQKCYAPFEEVYIKVDGWVMPCCGANGMGMGNILNTDLKTIWNNRHYRKLRRCVNSNNPPKECRTCWLSTGITCGNEKFLETIDSENLPFPPDIGFRWSDEKQKVIEY